MHRRWSPPPKQYGFSLIEAAIVLGVVGLVIGGIWVVAAKVRRDYNFNKDMEMILYGIEKTRSLFPRFSTTHTNLYPTAQESVSMGIIPKSTFIGNQPRTYSGLLLDLPYEVNFDFSYISARVYDYAYMVKRADCIRMMSYLSKTKSIKQMDIQLEGGIFKTYTNFPLSITYLSGDMPTSKNCVEITFSFNF